MSNLKYGPYSPSRLDTGICGHAFWDQYVNPNAKRSPDNLPQARGSAVHEIFEQITKKMIDNKGLCSFSDQELKGWTEQMIRKFPAAYEQTGEILHMAKLYTHKPPAILTEDAELEMRLAIKFERDSEGKIKTYKDPKLMTPTPVMKSESEYMTDEHGNIVYEDEPTVRPALIPCDYDDPDALARGRADILMISDDTTHAIIYDHKTQMNAEEADTFQMGFYAWVISRTYPFLDHVKTILHFAQYGKYSEPYIWTQEDLYNIEEEVLTRIGILENRDNWDATPHHKCQYCNCMITCPAMAEVLEIDAESGGITVKNQDFKILGNTTKAVKMAGWINVMENVMGEMKKSLREHIKESGAIAIPGKIFEYRPEDKVNWDKVNKKLTDQYVEICEKHKIDPKTYMGLSQTLSKSIWFNSNKDFVNDIKELFPIRLSTTFKGYK